MNWICSSVDSGYSLMMCHVGVMEPGQPMCAGASGKKLG